MLMDFYRHWRSATHFRLENTRQAEKTLGTIISERIFVNIIGQRDNQLQLEGSWREKESVLKASIFSERISLHIL